MLFNGKHFFPKAIIFDMDGTIVGTEAFHHLSYRDFIPQIKQSDIEGLSDDQVWRKFDRHPTSQIKHQREESFTQTIKKASNLGQYLTPGVENFTKQALEQGVPLAVVTSSLKCEAHSVLTALGLMKRFKYIITRDDVFSPKPSPAPYFMALRMLGLRAEQALVFEDSLTGLTASKAAGVPTIEVTHHKSGSYTENAISSFDELIALNKGIINFSRSF